jgi:hypothetical protein
MATSSQPTEWYPLGITEFVVSPIASMAAAAIARKPAAKSHISKTIMLAMLSSGNRRRFQHHVKPLRPRLFLFCLVCVSRGLLDEV